MRLILFLSILALPAWLFSQASYLPIEQTGEEEIVYINGIKIEGNKKTETAIIRRELLLKPGDTIAIKELSALLERSEELIMNTGLFTRAAISFEEWEGATNRISLLVFVEEAWYLYPVPIFELADRNFNVWWVEQNRSLQRTNVGLDFAHINLSGRSDKLKFSAKYGYTRKYSAAYIIPYINRQQTLGLSAEVAFFRNRELNYQTRDNKQFFYHDSNQFVYQRLRLMSGISYRPRINSLHQWNLSYRQNQVDEVVATELNPDFFLDGRSLQRYFSLNYRYSFDKRDVQAYPWDGNVFSAQVIKDGLGFFSDRNGLELYLEYGQHFAMGKRWSLGMNAKTKTSLIRQRQPFNDNQAMGYGDNFLHGFEYYVIDGMDMGILKTSMKFRFWDSGIDFARLMPIDALKYMPFHCNLTLNSDYGYVNSPYTRDLNPLSNRMLWGGGIGLDIVLYYNKVIQIEYSVNDLLENGLFLHLSMNL